MTTDLDALGASTPETSTLTGPECACGCGETLPPGSSRQYKRGHKTSPADPDFFAPDDIRGITLDDAAADTPNDPDPADFKETKIHVRITKAVREDISGKLGMMFGFMSMGLSVRDPICGGAIGDNADTIIPKLVPIICKSPDMVRWFTSKNSGYLIWFELIMVLWPVMQVVIAHHVTHSIGKPRGAGPDGRTIIPNAQVPDFRSAYPA
jgi:hypothetical protein